MKKLILLLAVIYLTKAKAQTWVNLPDIQFANYLQNTIPSAMSGLMLDISHTLVTTVTKTINVGNLSISNLNGIQYFISLTYLDCHNNLLTTIPPYATSVQTLICFDNSLSSLSVLNNNLTYLDCNSNSLTNLPTLPDSLKYLDCNYNSLSNLPTLPNGLKYLDCNSNSLTNLPALPNSLLYLDCSKHYNDLTNLPILANSIQTLICYSNSLNNLPALPNSLKYLNCEDSYLTNLPTLPNSLLDLNCFNNSLTTLPSLPNLLKNLNCNNNHISCFPTFPNSIVNINIDSNPYNCLPNYVLPAMVLYSNIPLCVSGNINGCAVAGFEEFSANSYQLTVYPNPTKEILYVELEEELNPSTSLRVTDYKLKIVNILGVEVHTTNNFKQLTQLNIGHLQNGIYFLQVLQDNEVVATKKIIKE